jgi:hypothetical protein
LSGLDDSPPLLRWSELPDEARALLRGRLAGLYGHPDDAAAFDSLTVDKQQALLICARRLSAVRLWRAVRRVTNVYGEGGVGLSFEASPALSRLLRRSPCFTRRFASHRDAAEGYFERRSRAALHLLRGDGGGGGWSAHFDLHGPLGSPASAVRHLWREKLRAHTPDWREIGEALGYAGARWSGAAGESAE